MRNKTQNAETSTRKNSSVSRVDFRSLKTRVSVSPKRTGLNLAQRGFIGLGINRLRSFRGEQKSDITLFESSLLSERFQPMQQTIYGIGFTCVVVMGVERDTQQVC